MWFRGGIGLGRLPDIPILLTMIGKLCLENGLLKFGAAKKTSWSSVLLSHQNRNDATQQVAGVNRRCHGGCNLYCANVGGGSAFYVRTALHAMNIQRIIFTLCFSRFVCRWLH